MNALTTQIEFIFAFDSSEIPFRDAVSLLRSFDNIEVHFVSVLFSLINSIFKKNILTSLSFMDETMFEI